MVERNADESGEAEGGARLDIWLWRARLFKTRALAGERIRKRGVRIDRSGLLRKTDKPGATVRPGDILTLAVGKTVRTVEVCALGTRRGPAPEAQALFEEKTP